MFRDCKSVLKRTKYTLNTIAPLTMLKKCLPLLIGVALVNCNTATQPTATDSKGLKDYYQNYFPIGVAVSPEALHNEDSTLILQHFSSLTPENCMKPEAIHPKENEYNWKDADSVVAFAQRNGYKVRGHCLVWHEQLPGWWFKDAKGGTITKDALLLRMKQHIDSVVGRYKGKVYAWDVVNEAVDDDSTKLYRNSMWYQVCGEDFIAKAFEYAHAADPDAVLFYNDYNTERPEKTKRVYEFLKKLVDAKVPINAVGLQAHWSIYEPSRAELEDAIQKFSSLGLKVQITELDMSVYPWEKLKRVKKPDEQETYTSELEQKQAAQYKMVFDVFRKYKDAITGVTFWNISDKVTWLDHYPVEGRKNYPLLFDTANKPKKAYSDVINF